MFEEFIFSLSEYERIVFKRILRKLFNTIGRYL